MCSYLQCLNNVLLQSETDIERLERDYTQIENIRNIKNIAIKIQNFIRIGNDCQISSSVPTAGNYYLHLMMRSPLIASICAHENCSQIRMQIYIFQKCSLFIASDSQSVRTVKRVF